MDGKLVTKPSRGSITIVRKIIVPFIFDLLYW